MFCKDMTAHPLPFSSVSKTTANTLNRRQSSHRQRHQAVELNSTDHRKKSQCFRLKRSYISMSIIYRSRPYSPIYCMKGLLTCDVWNNTQSPIIHVSLFCNFWSVQLKKHANKHPQVLLKQIINEKKINAFIQMIQSSLSCLTGTLGSAVKNGLFHYLCYAITNFCMTIPLYYLKQKLHKFHSK